MPDIFISQIGDGFPAYVGNCYSHGKRENQCAYYKYFPMLIFGGVVNIGMNRMMIHSQE